MLTFILIFPTKNDNIENIVTDRQSGKAFVKKMLMILDRIDCEKSTKVYIKKDNKDQFIKDFKALENLLNQKIGSYDLETTLLNFISQNSIRISSGNDFVADEAIKLIESFSKVDNFFTERNSDRKLNRTDFRHCENHPNYIKNKSPLIGGTNGFDNAEKYLPSAIGDIKTGRNILLNIDIDNQEHIIRYEDENFDNQFHAYHIVKNENGQYLQDELGMENLRNSRKNTRRSLILLEYRNTIK